MLKAAIDMMVISAIALSLSACGNRSKLKTPSQIRYQAEKQARRDAKKEKKQMGEASAVDAAVALPKSSAADDASYEAILDSQGYPATPSNHVGY